MQLSVGIAELKIAKRPALITTMALGSCVGIALYYEGMGGLAHAMLPKANGDRTNPAKFVDSAIEEMLKKIIEQGANKNLVLAKIAGGASMFSCEGGKGFKIGEKNVLAAKETLKKEGIRIVAEDTGSNYGRSLEFDVDTGKLMIKSVHGIKKL